MSKTKNTLPLVLRIIVAVILLQTRQYKFTGHPKSVYIFSKVGLEPYGRIIIGFLELISSMLLLIPKTVWIGATLTLGVIGGAILMHITKLGVEVNNDHGMLFITALITFVLSTIILWLKRKEIKFF